MRIAVMLHAHDLRLAEIESGETRFGGVYTWRVVDAAGSREAIELARASFREELAGNADVLNSPSETFQVIAEEVDILDPTSAGHDTGLVFYVDTDDSRNT